MIKRPIGLSNAQGQEVFDAWDQAFAATASMDGVDNLLSPNFSLKALYGLRSSGARFYKALAHTLRKEGFIPSKADLDSWMHLAGSCCKYVCIYVDDMLVVMKEPETFFQNLSKRHGYKLKAVGNPEYHLGGNFSRDPDGTLFWGAKTYIEKSLKVYEHIFGSLPSQRTSYPIDKDDHLELDDSSLFEEPDIKIYQSLIGSLPFIQF